MKSFIVSNVTKCNAATFTNLPHEICPPTPCKKNSICYENTAIVFFSRARPGTPTPRENFFQARIFFPPPPWLDGKQPLMNQLWGAPPVRKHKGRRKNASGQHSQVCTLEVDNYDKRKLRASSPYPS